MTRNLSISLIAAALAETVLELGRLHGIAPMSAAADAVQPDDESDDAEPDSETDETD